MADAGFDRTSVTTTKPRLIMAEHTFRPVGILRNDERSKAEWVLPLDRRVPVGFGGPDAGVMSDFNAPITGAGPTVAFDLAHTFSRRTRPGPEVWIDVTAVQWQVGERRPV